MNTANKSHNYPLYEEGKDFIVEKYLSDGNTFFYFRSLEGDLIGYIKIHYEVISDGTFFLRRGIIVDTISASQIGKHTSSTTDDFFREHGYTGFALPDFGTTMYKVVLHYFQTQYSSDIFLEIASHEGNREVILKLLKKVSERTTGIIRDYRGGDNDNAAVVYLDDLHTDETET